MIRLVPRNKSRVSGKSSPISATALRSRRKFLRFFPGGFADETYKAWERDYKFAAHLKWAAVLKKADFKNLLDAGRFEDIAAHATRVESRTNLLFSFEKMALRDAVRSTDGARDFSKGLYEWLYGAGPARLRFENWCETLGALPRQQTRVLTWPMATVFGFLAEPAHHVFLKPIVTRTAAAAYGFDFHYLSRPNWDTYSGLLAFAKEVLTDQRDLHPRDMIDAQSFIWVLGSSEYDEASH